MAKQYISNDVKNLARPLANQRPLPEGCSRVKALVEGYEDIAFWRGIFDEYESPLVSFDISVPARDDLAKGKKTLLKMADKGSKQLIMCMDSDFDYLFANQTEDARRINSSPYLFHTYAYATENYLCFAPTLHNICVKATKNDSRIFDFVRFMTEYSRAIFPAFVWYAFSAQISEPSIFILADLKNTVRIGYLDTVADNGAGTIEWVSRQVARRVQRLETDHPRTAERLPAFEKMLSERGVTSDNAYLFMHGHTLMDNVTVVVLDAVCNELKRLSLARIDGSTRQGVARVNEQSNYNNSLYNVRDVLLFNEQYKNCFLYQKLRSDIEQFIAASGYLNRYY